jgi:Na+-driven multidrug efflux pump
MQYASLKAFSSLSEDDSTLNPLGLPLPTNTQGAFHNNTSQSNEDDTSPEQSSGPPFSWNRQNLGIALPALMGLMADPFLSMVDTGFVGRLGVMDLAALGVCTSVFHMCFSIFRGSTTATISLLHAAHNERERRHITKISLQFGAVLGAMVLLGLRFLGGGTWLLATMGVDPGSPLYPSACSYLFARAWAAPAVVGSTFAVAEQRWTNQPTNELTLTHVVLVVIGIQLWSQREPFGEMTTPKLH